MNERFDQLLSARRDGALDSAEVAELDRLLDASENARRRALAFEDVDASLRRLAAEVIPEERLDRGHAVLTGRLGASHESGTRRLHWASRGLSRRRVLGWGIAAAAALWIASLMIPRGDEGVDDLESLGIAETSDLEVIDELELLEFLADRDSQMEGPRG